MKNHDEALTRPMSREEVLALSPKARAERKAAMRRKHARDYNAKQREAARQGSPEAAAWATQDITKGVGGIDRIEAALTAMLNAQRALLEAVTGLVIEMRHPLRQAAPAPTAAPSPYIREPDPHEPPLPLQMPPIVDRTDPMAEMATEIAVEEEELPPAPDEFQAWARRVAMFRQNRMWMPDWGPKPGHPDCEAPAQLLRGR